MTTVEHPVPDTLEEQFQALVDAGERIEPTDQMPPGYRRHLIRQICQHAHGEVVGMQPEANWLTRAPTLRRKAVLLAKIQDEAGHGLYLYGVAETLGAAREEFLAESFHQRQGFQGVLEMARGTDAQRRMAQDALDRFWFPVLTVPGPPDSDSPHLGSATRWGIKRVTNDEVRQRFVDSVVPQAEFLGLRIPDGGLHWNADRGHYDFTQPDWAEWERVVAGDGPCNRERLETVVRAHEDGAWVRAAVSAHAAKRTALEEGAA